MNIKNTKTTSGIVLTLIGLCAGAFAQESGGIGIGVGLGVGVGTGIGANIDVERVPGNVVQGRRVFAAKLVAGSVSTTNRWIGPGGGSASGVGGIPRGLGSGFAQSGSVQTREYSTVVSLFNPSSTTAVTVNVQNTGAALAAVGPYTLPPLTSHHIHVAGPNPAPLGMPAVGFLVIESQAPLEVVALYQYRDERIDGQSEAWIETSAGALFGPGF